MALNRHLPGAPLAHPHAVAIPVSLKKDAGLVQGRPETSAFQMAGADGQSEIIAGNLFRALSLSRASE